MSAPELKPCPFCGGEAEIDFGLLHTPREAGREFISCPTVTCGAYAYGADAWNTRADLAPAAPKVKALVWVELARGLFGATTPFGCYHVWEGHYQAPCDKMGQPALDPRSEAQADYEARILAALEEQ